ncbi:hypothetical protein [Kribbella hippodromi]
MRRGAVEEVVRGRQWNRPDAARGTSEAEQRALYGQVDRVSGQLALADAQNEQLSRQAAALERQNAANQQRIAEQQQLLADQRNQDAELNQTDLNRDGIPDTRNRDLDADRNNQVRVADEQRNQNAGDLDKNGVVDTLDREHDKQAQLEEADRKKKAEASDREGVNAVDGAGAAAGGVVAAEEIKDELDERADRQGAQTDQAEQDTVNPDATDATALDTTDPFHEQSAVDTPTVDEHGAPLDAEADELKNPWADHEDAFDGLGAEDPTTDPTVDRDAEAAPASTADNELQSGSPDGPSEYVTDTDTARDAVQEPASDPYVTDTAAEADLPQEQQPETDPYATDTDTAREADPSADLGSPDRSQTAQTLNQDQRQSQEPQGQLQDPAAPAQTQDARTLAQTQDAQAPTQAQDAQALTQDTQSPGQAQQPQDLAQGQNPQGPGQDAQSPGLGQDAQGPAQGGNQSGQVISADHIDELTVNNGAVQTSGQRNSPALPAEEPLIAEYRDARASEQGRGQPSRSSDMTPDEQRTTAYVTSAGRASASGATVRSDGGPTTTTSAGERPDHLRDTRTASKPRTPQQTNSNTLGG